MILLLIFLSLISPNIHAQKSSGKLKITMIYWINHRLFEFDVGYIWNFSIFTIESCPEGYVFVSGDVPGWGSDLGGRIRLSRQECAIRCNKHRDCHSFEHSNTKNLCNLNRIAETTQGPFEDFVFCVKQEGKKCFNLFIFILIIFLGLF